MRNNFKLSAAFTKFSQDVWLKKNNQLYTFDRSSDRRGRLQVIITPEMIKQEIYSTFSPVYQHDCHEFLTYIMSNLQDEETPIYGKPGAQTQSAAMSGFDQEEESWAKYESTHPSVIDKLFSGRHTASYEIS